MVGWGSGRSIGIGTGVPELGTSRPPPHVAVGASRQPMPILFSQFLLAADRADFSDALFSFWPLPVGLLPWLCGSKLSHVGFEWTPFVKISSVCASSQKKKKHLWLCVVTYLLAKYCAYKLNFTIRSSYAWTIKMFFRFQKKEVWLGNLSGRLTWLGNLQIFRKFCNYLIIISLKLDQLIFWLEPCSNFEVKNISVKLKKIWTLHSKGI